METTSYLLIFIAAFIAGIFTNRLLCRKATDLKTVLELQKENTLLHRAILDACVMLQERKRHPVILYGIDDVSWLFDRIFKVLDFLEKKENEKQQPAN
jgi:hypothetical protein